MADKSKLIPYFVRVIHALDSSAAWDLYENQPNNLGEFLRQKKLKQSDLYDSIVYRSSKKNNPDFYEELKLEDYIDFDLLEKLIPKDENGKFKITPTDWLYDLSFEFTKEKNLYDLREESSFLENIRGRKDYRLNISNLLYYNESHKYYSDAIVNQEAKEDLNESAHEREKELIEKLTSLNGNPFGNSYRYGFSENDTGFFLKEYNLLRWDPIFLENEYKKTLKEFDLKVFDLKENVLKITVLVGDYRDLLATQIERQQKQLHEINKIVIDHLSLFYNKVENSMMDQMPNDEEGHEGLLVSMHPVIKDRLYIFKIMNAIHLTFHLNDNDPGILDYHTERITEIPYIDKQTKDDLKSDLELFSMKKEPILRVARKLALKSSICESILEDLLMREPIKSFDEFCENFRPQLTGKMIDKRVQLNYDNRMTWENIFDDTRDWLFKTHGLDEKSVKSKFDFSISDKESFERIMRKRIKLRTRNS